MTTPAFPAAIKPIVSQGYSFNTPSNVIELSVAGGLPLMIREFKTAAVAFNVVLILNPLRLQVWSDFYFSKIASGSGKFTMNLEAGNGIEECICSLIPSTVQQSSNDQLIWTIAFTVLAEKTAAQDDPFGGNLVDLFNIYGDDLLTIFDRITIFALDDIPEEMT